MWTAVHEDHEVTCGTGEMQCTEFADEITCMRYESWGLGYFRMYYKIGQTAAPSIKRTMRIFLEGWTLGMVWYALFLKLHIGTSGEEEC